MSRSIRVMLWGALLVALRLAGEARAPTTSPRCRPYPWLRPRPLRLPRPRTRPTRGTPGNPHPSQLANSTGTASPCSTLWNGDCRKPHAEPRGPLLSLPYRPALPAQTRCRSRLAKQALTPSSTPPSRVALGYLPPLPGDIPMGRSETIARFG